MELLMIYKISPCLPAPVPTEGGAGRLTPLCPPGQRPYGPEAKEGERKGRNVPTISRDRIDFNQLLEKIKKYGLEQEWEKAQKISQD
jgi:hypothetical protein